MLIGRPAAYYSTPVTKTHDNKPVATPAVPRWFKGCPADGWVRVTSGEAMVGLFNLETAVELRNTRKARKRIPVDQRVGYMPGGEWLYTQRRKST